VREHCRRIEVEFGSYQRAWLNWEKTTGSEGALKIKAQSRHHHQQKKQKKEKDRRKETRLGKDMYGRVEEESEQAGCVLE